MSKKKFFFSKKDEDVQKKALDHFNKEGQKISGEDVTGGQWVENSQGSGWVEAVGGKNSPLDSDNI
ncbi:hypothetical protein SAMN04515674_10698 [Pseudarcicella hirudinis]|uniref:Uncharacterized protein n=1 Tax=Pseudarcicella hirudinis TaxID=1079859 RepID=A0A1I5TL04_9BACT|nr:hypothetical protein [Pseudarcicella hirudinis]SFP83754.1 hypothetical protein SAMN04515674_10698 [Pseudarcicella hirudinis]